MIKRNTIHSSVLKLFLIFIILVMSCTENVRFIKEIRFRSEEWLGPVFMDSGTRTRSTVWDGLHNYFKTISIASWTILKITDPAQKKQQRKLQQNVSREQQHVPSTTINTRCKSYKHTDVTWVSIALSKNNKSCARRKIIIMKLQRKSLKCPAKYLLHSFHPPDSRAEDNSSMLHQARWVSPSLDPWITLRELKWKTTKTFWFSSWWNSKLTQRKLEWLPLCITFCFVKRF